MIDVSDNNSIVQKKILKVRDSKSQVHSDSLVTEEPLEISISYYKNGQLSSSPISMTMRTPGDDQHLALGFLYTEGIIHSNNDIEEFSVVEENKINVHLKSHVQVDIERLSRHLFTSSSCGVCGKTSIDNLKTIIPENGFDQNFKVESDALYDLGKKLRERQSLFESTGGIHAAAAFCPYGNFKELAEDVGRHNALDKLIGIHLHKNVWPINKRILLVSGRASFELVQKALMANVPIMCAIGSPSSMAVDLAEEYGMCLIGFLKPDSYNIYTHSERIIFSK